MKNLILGAFAGAATGPALAHSDATVHLHGADVGIWVVVALIVAISALVLFRGT